MATKHGAKPFIPKWLSRLLGPLALSLLCGFAIAITWVFYLNYPESPDRIVSFPHVEKRIVAFSPDGKTAEIYAVGRDKNYSQPKVVDVETGRTIIEPSRLVRPVDPAYKDLDPQVAQYVRDHTKVSGFDPTGKRYCVISNQIEVVDVPSGRTRFVHACLTDSISNVSVDWSRDGKVFAVLEPAKLSTLTVYDVETAMVRQRLQGPKMPCDLNFDGSWLLAKSHENDNECLIFEVSSGKVRQRVTGPPNSVLRFAKAGTHSNIAAIGFGIGPNDEEHSKCDVQIISIPDAKLIGEFQSRGSENPSTVFQMKDQFLCVGGQCFDLDRKPMTYVDDLLGNAGVTFAEKIDRLVTSRSNNSGHGDYSIRDPKTLHRFYQGSAWNFLYIADDGRFLMNLNDEYLTPNEIVRYFLASGRSYACYSMNVIFVQTGQVIRTVSMRQDFDNRSYHPVIFRPEYNEVWIENTRHGPNKLEYHVFDIEKQRESTFWPWMVSGLITAAYLVLLAGHYVRNKARQRHPATPSLT